MAQRHPASALILIAMAVLSWLAGAPSLARAEAAAGKAACVTASCHPNLGKARFVHGPVAVGECTGCHKQIGKHAFEPIRDPGKQCEECHEGLHTQKVVHKPVKEGKCTTCHDPHQSGFKFQLRAEGADLCFLCHDKAIAGGKYLHGPLGTGSCNSCHAAHQSEFPRLLSAAGNDVCFSCHTDKAESFKKSRFMHSPVREACVNCHSPHSSNYRYTLSAQGSQDLCYSCHTDKAKEIPGATVPHLALATDRKCLACHDPHVSDFPRQLTKQPMDLCLSCHDREYNGANGKIANLKSVLANNAVHHGPIQEKDCSGCHNPHGSKNFRILRESFPQLFYAPYSPDNYKLCFMCHQKTIASEETTVTLTGFRNGDQNLHFVHVNKSVKGRTCRACHDAHATNNPKHVRDSVPFAKWNLPVGFQKTKTGGSCQPGCHQLFGYDRAVPVVNKPVAK
ncbi:cytochrome c [Geomonas silvestris]|uniref:Cytochrome c n=1 Tax=Geomonas silvestris TaxID=2740184 RepID=A0A6V8MKZ0_9BACT|nr:cytochrome c3 family protein [Geomonas silvestris]GFO60705.1 cytochrome c [Geomonas silvestris]